MAEGWDWDEDHAVEEDTSCLHEVLGYQWLRINPRVRGLGEGAYAEVALHVSGCRSHTAYYPLLSSIPRDPFDGILRFTACHAYLSFAG